MIHLDTSVLIDALTGAKRSASALRDAIGQGERIAVSALVLYDASRKSFKKGENVTEQQQAVRVAFDRLNADLRTAGLNYNPDGDPDRLDEQIEAAYDTAIVVRADFDAEDPAANTTPESDLDGGAFLAVSTGNDEIVTYALAKPDGSSTGAIAFFADVRDQRIITYGHSLFIALIVSITWATMLASVLTFHRDNLLLDNLLSHAMSDAVKEQFVRLVWNPPAFIMAASAVVFLALIALSVVVRVFSMAVRTRAATSTASPGS